jgi:hypothetical protein
MIGLNVVSFDCDRTCPKYEKEQGGLFLCRFMAILTFARLAVHSHTAKITVEYHKHIDALKAAVEAMGGTWLGEGTHKLFDGSKSGWGFRLPKWNYPLVVDASGQLSYDDYNGAWGKVADLDRLKGAFAVQAAYQNASALGWQTEMAGDKLIVHHPEGGQIEIDADKISTSGFQGGACHAAREALGLAVSDIQNTGEFCEEAQRIKEST